MLFFRDRPMGTSFWQRFRTAPEGFTVVREQDDYWAFHVVSGAERIFDLYVALLNEYRATVSVVIDDGHAHRAWKGDACPAAAVRDAVAPLRALLVAPGGVELTVFTEDDQVTLNPMLEMFIYSHSERWTKVLEGKGLTEQRLVRTRSWRAGRRDLAPAPELSDAVAAVARALGLAPA